MLVGLRLATAPTKYWVSVSWYPEVAVFSTPVAVL